MADRLPVTVLSGYTGTGKTSLLQQLLAAAGGKRIGVAGSLPEAGKLAQQRRFRSSAARNRGNGKIRMATAEAVLFEDEHGTGTALRLGYAGHGGRCVDVPAGRQRCRIPAGPWPEHAGQRGQRGRRGRQRTTRTTTAPWSMC
ncbi:GTP-binding protein [Cupriavidus basilensis]